MSEFDSQTISRLKKSLYNGCSLNEDDAQLMADYIDRLEQQLDFSDDVDARDWRNEIFGQQDQEC